MPSCRVPDPAPEAGQGEHERGPSQAKRAEHDRGQPGRARRAPPEATDLTILTYANGLHISLRIVRRLEERHGICARVVDLRWPAPLPLQDILREAAATGRVLVVDETRRSGGVSEGVVTALVDEGFTGPIRRVASEDSFIPLGNAALTVLLSEDTIEAAAVKLVQK